MRGASVVARRLVVTLETREDLRRRSAAGSGSDLANTMAMNSEDWGQTVECVDCGAPISPALDRCFGFEEDAYLCFDCATRRGGVYEHRFERWSVFPEVTGDREAMGVW